MAPAGGLPQQVLTPLRASFWINRFLPVLLAPPFMSDPRVQPWLSIHCNLREETDAWSPQYLEGDEGLDTGALDM